ncbi:Arginine transport system permease protein ArtQ [bioreactor metagenome]|jgi:His/Glu/Gln/Arg/opine family amino acid ABC transporter permease subunit|uniref:Polar amino acid transport system permease protein n=2 Tax=root TaxID=1 RepID=A0A562JBY1_9FIRM|nr:MULTISPECIES: amino acid ABC transporter permease [Sedimentibacter]MEA5093896.1 amino acid ABC transporter permease [Sedimentibacter saalensis]TWH80603.1 polar amino acid transport system permease protein [Sedimentibacter saalensis]
MFQTIIDLWIKYDYVYMNGLLGTLILAAITVLVATIIGTVVAIMKLSKIKILDWITSLYIGILRGTPILLQLYFFWLLLPKIVPFELSDTACIIIALIVNASSYVAEVIRAGIQAVDKGQTEAAKSLGLSNYNTMRKIILPQAIKNILPALGNEYITMVKQTSLASVFFVQELMTAYKTVQSATFLAIPSLIIVGAIYLVVTTVLTKALTMFERRLKVNEQ